jgi:hypothetical protein
MTRPGSRTIRCLTKIDVAGQSYNVLFTHASPLRPILPHEVDDKVACLDARDTSASSQDATDTFCTGYRRQGWSCPIDAATKPDVRRIYRKRKHLKYYLADIWHAYVFNISALSDAFWHAIGSYLHLLHLTLLNLVTTLTPATISMADHSPKSWSAAAPPESLRLYG